MSEIAWRTDEPCPVCGAGLFVLERLAGLFAECRLCGYAITLASDEITDWR